MKFSSIFFIICSTAFLVCPYTCGAWGKIVKSKKSAPFFTHAEVNCALHSRQCSNPEQVGGQMYLLDKKCGCTTYSRSRKPPRRPPPRHYVQNQLHVRHLQPTRKTKKRENPSRLLNSFPRCKMFRSCFTMHIYKIKKKKSKKRTGCSVAERFFSPLNWPVCPFTFGMRGSSASVS